MQPLQPLRNLHASGKLDEPGFQRLAAPDLIDGAVGKDLPVDDHCDVVVPGPVGAPACTGRRTQQGRPLG